MLLGLWEGVSEVMGWYTEVWIVAQNPKRRRLIDGFEHVVVFLGGGECEGQSGHSLGVPGRRVSEVRVGPFVVMEIQCVADRVWEEQLLLFHERRC